MKPFSGHWSSFKLSKQGGYIIGSGWLYNLISFEVILVRNMLSCPFSVSLS